MKKYKVISLTVGGLGNKIFNHGDIVNESNFPTGNAVLLVKQGFLEEHNETTEEVKTIAEVVTTPVVTEPAKTDAVVTEPAVIPPAVVVVPEYDSVTKADLFVTLTEKGIEFPKDANKQELFDLAYPPKTDLI